jgi:glycosyltransferase involved in cell wall biosynthesis
VNWLKHLAASLGVNDAVEFVGHVTQAQMVTYFRLADLYVSMSEHEGFGKPLIEGMHLGLPILAFATTAVPYTMGEAGVLFHHKHYPALAELVDILVSDSALRSRIVDRQKVHAHFFLESQVRLTWMQAVSSL